MQSFYSGLTDESKQMIDLTAEGSLSNLTLKQCKDLIMTRASNGDLYNPGLNTEVKNGMLFITPELMPEVKKSMKEKGMQQNFLKIIN